MVKRKLNSKWSQESEQLRGFKRTCMDNLLSTTEECLYFKDLQSRFVLVNAGFLARVIPDGTAEEVIGKTDFDLFSEEHAASAFADEQQIIRTGEPVVEKLERETFHDRPHNWVSSTKMPLKDAARPDHRDIRHFPRRYDADHGGERSGLPGPARPGDRSREPGRPHGPAVSGSCRA